MNPFWYMIPLLTWWLDKKRLEAADVKAEENIREGIGGLEGMAAQYTPDQLVDAVGFPSKLDIFGGGLARNPGMFSSYDVFQQYAPDQYDPITAGQFDPESAEYIYDPTELQEFGAGIGEQLRQGGDVDFGNVMQEIAGRFPDVGAWEGARLSGVSEAGRQHLGQAREAVRSEFGGDLAAGAAAMKGAELGSAQQTGRSALGVSAGAEDLRRQMASDLGGLQTQLTGMEEQFGTQRDIAAMQEQGRLFGMGEELEAGTAGATQQRLYEGGLGDIFNQLQVDQLNRTLPMDMATMAARAQSVDEMGGLQALLSILGMKTQLTGAGAGMQIDTQAKIADLLAAITQNVPLLTEGVVNPFMQGLLGMEMKPDTGGMWAKI